jgi:hypothetical protein
MSHENLTMRLSGDVYLQKIASTEQPVIGPLPAEVFGIQSQSDLIEVQDTRRSKRGQRLVAVPDPKPPVGSLTLLAVPPKVLALLAMGTETTLSQTAQTVTDESHPYVKDFGIQLLFRNVGTVVVKPTVGGTPFVVGTDYEILDAHEGIIRPLAGGGMSGTTCYISYHAGVIAAPAVVWGSESTVRAKVRLVGTNDASGAQEEVRWEGASVLLTPDGEIDLMAKEPIKAKFKMAPETVSGAAGPAFLSFPTYTAPAA